MTTQPQGPCPKCGRRHRTWYAVASCRWPKPLWVMGNGCWASLSRCHPGCTIILFGSEVEALEAKASIDKFACGGACCRRHYVVDLAEWYGRARA